MLDLILLILLLLCILRGYHAGFFAGIKDIASIVLGILIAATFVKPFTLFLTEHTGLKDSLSGWLAEKFPASAELSAETLPALPDTSSAPLFETLGKLGDQINHLLPQSLLNDTAASAVEWFANLLTSCIAFAVLLLVSIILLRILAQILSKSFDATRPSYMLNHMAGAALYAAEFLFVAALLFYVARPLLLTGSTLNIAWLSAAQQAADHSLVVRALGNILQSLGWM